MKNQKQNKRIKRNNRKALFFSLMMHLAVIAGILYASGDMESINSLFSGDQIEEAGDLKMEAPKDKVLTSTSPKKKAKVKP